MPGLYGHIPHLYEDHNLRFRDLKEVIRSLGSDKIDAYEKFDGQNLYVCWDFDDDKLKVARNKKNIKERGLDRYGLSLKFGDRPNIEKSFVEAYDALDKAIRPIPHNSKRGLFGSTGGIWFSIEIINPDLPNTIHYDSKNIYFHKHGPILFSFDGEPIQTKLHQNLKTLELLIDSMNENLGTSEWHIHGPVPFPVKQIDESFINEFSRTMSMICLKSGIGDNLTIREFLYRRLLDDMQRFPIVPHQIQVDVAKWLVKKPGASKKLKEICPKHDRLMTEQITTMANEEKKVMEKLLAPIEAAIHGFSTKFLSNMKSQLIEDIQIESTRLRKEFDKSCDILRKRNDVELLNKMIPKIGDGIITMEGMVFIYRDRLYKISGAFSPMNKIIAKLKYENKSKITNENNTCLSQYFIAG